MAQTPPEYFRRRSDLLSLVVVVGHFALVFAPVYALAALGPSLLILPVWLWFGLSMNGLLNLLHESAHGLVFSSKGPSEALGRYVLAPLVFADFDGYRERHWDHHRFLGVDGETKDTYLIDIRGGRVFTLLVRSLLCVEALKRFTKQTGGGAAVDDEAASKARTSGKAKGVAWLVRVALVQALVSGTLFLTGLLAGFDVVTALWQGALVYGFVVVYGLMSLTIFAAALRAIAEHQIYGTCDRQGQAALRNFHCNAATRFLMGAYGFGEHAVHHLHPAVPSYRLPALLRTLVVAQPSLAPRHGYFGGLAQAITSTSDLTSATSEKP
jgi:fatty acid desaturase